MSDHEDVIIPDFYTKEGIITGSRAKEDERQNAQVKALMTFFHRLPYEKRKTIYYVEFKPRAGNQEYKGRFRVTNDDDPEYRDWFDYAQQIARGNSKRWNRDGTPKLELDKSAQTSA